MTDIFQIFKDNADFEYAAKMSKYMRYQFPYVGISIPNLRKLSKDFLNAAKKHNEIDWDFVFDCWKDGREREFQYLASHYLWAVSHLLTPKDIPNLKKLALDKSWWDTIDSLDRLIGGIALKYPEVNEILLNWSVDENFWLRRIAIDHQLLRKEKTNTDLLEQIIINNFGQSEFFINKAIGWSLREYSKTNPKWVRGFIAKHKNKMAALSIREASKYI